MGLLLLTGVYAVGLCILYMAYVIFHQYTYWKRRKIPHLKLVPLVGNNAPIFFRYASLPEHFVNMYNEFPGSRYFGYFDFKKPAVLLKDPELIRDVCIKSFDNFVNHETFVSEEMDPVIGSNLFSLKGDRWKEVRNTVTPSFTSSRMKIIFTLMSECSKNFVQYFLDNPELAKSFEAKDAFTRYTSDIIATSAFGIQVDSMADRKNEFFMHGIIATVFSALGVVRFELLHNFPKLMRSLGMTFLPAQTDRFFKRLITDNIKIRKEKNIVREDMLHLMMQAMDKNKVTVDDIVGQAFFFFLGGFDSSSALMCFIAQELAVNPEVQERLRQEIDRALEKNNGEVTYDLLKGMKYLDMVVNEALRKYPTAPFTNRVCNQTYDFPASTDGYPEYRMEKGTIVTLPIYALHHDPQYFPNPDKFDPERFSDENKDKINPYVYMPFGIGPRQCIGYRFALMETKILFINILSKFEIKFTEKSRHPVEFEKINFTMAAKGGFWIKLEERKKIN